MKRKHKAYSRPKKPFDKARIDEEGEIKKEFGLKNKKEIWRADARVKKMREKAKKRITATPENQQILFDRLNKMGMNVNSIADVLGLDKKDVLNRRLQTVVTKKGLATTVNGARQLITHKKVLVDGQIVDSPSYIVPVSLEDKISLKKKVKKPKVEKVEEQTEEVKEEAVSNANAPQTESEIEGKEAKE